MPDDAFVFSMHQGYIFEYFRLKDGDDPPVHSFLETEPDARIISGSFSEYLKARVAAYLAIQDHIARLDSDVSEA